MVKVNFTIDEAHKLIDTWEHRIQKTNLSNVLFALSANVSQSSLQNILRGRNKNPNIKTVAKIETTLQRLETEDIKCQKINLK